jgi:hypothetical protein
MKTKSAKRVSGEYYSQVVSSNWVIGANITPDRNPDQLSITHHNPRTTVGFTIVLGKVSKNDCKVLSEMFADLAKG